MELSCGPPATTARLHTHDTTVASEVPPKAALRAVHAPPCDGRPGSWSDWLARLPPSRATDPVIGSSLKVHYGENADARRCVRVENAVGKPVQETTPCRAADQRTDFRMFDDGSGAPLNFVEEGSPEAGALSLVILRCVAELELGEAVVGDA